MAQSDFVQEVCLELLDTKGKTVYRKWYKDRRSAQVTKCKLQPVLGKAGFTWVIWTFERETSSEVLLWSSRPLGWRFVPVA